MRAGPARMVARGGDGHLPAWLSRSEGEGRWSAAASIATIIGLQLALPGEYAVNPRWILPLIESMFLVILVVLHPERLSRRSPTLRRLSLALLAIMTGYLAVSLARLVHNIVAGHGIKASALLIGGGAIWLSNVLVFALVYWEYDRGGPADRANAVNTEPDLLFPQMSDDEMARTWEPVYFDYLFVSFTCATAYSPTDTMPLTRWCKGLFTLESLLSLVTITLVTARAVNILPGN